MNNQNMYNFNLNSSNIIPFTFENTSVRVFNINDEAWFVANDVASALGYSKPRNAISVHCKAAISIGALNQGSLDPQTKVIPERDVYRLVMRSKLPSAEQFEEKVVGEILPSIRKTGGYQPTVDFNDPSFLRSTLLTYTEKCLVLESENKELKPKADGYDRIASSDGSICITDAAKDLQIRPKELFDYLQAHKWIYRRAGNKNWIAYQDKIQQGLLEHKVTDIFCNDGTSKLREQVKITTKGLTKLSEVFSQQLA